MRLHLAQAFSNRAPRGRKHDFKDAERLVRRLIANELILSFVPERGTAYLAQHDPHEAATHARPSTTAEPDRVFAGRNADQAVDCRQQSTGRQRACAFCMLWPEGETDPKKLAQLGDERLQCTRGATGGCFDGKSAAHAWGNVGAYNYSDCS